MWRFQLSTAISFCFYNIACSVLCSVHIFPHLKFHFEKPESISELRVRRRGEKTDNIKKEEMDRFGFFLSFCYVHRQNSNNNIIFQHHHLIRLYTFFPFFYFYNFFFVFFNVPCFCLTQMMMMQLRGRMRKRKRWSVTDLYRWITNYNRIRMYKFSSQNESTVPHISV